MINSMTGYGDAEDQLNGVTYAVEIKTVNNRYFKARIKLPETMVFLEEDVEKLLRRSLSRGMVSYVLRLRNVSWPPSCGVPDAKKGVLGPYNTSGSRFAKESKMWPRQNGTAANVLFEIDETALRAIIEQLGRILSSVDIKCPIDIGGLLMLPGILAPVPPDEERAGQIKKKVLSITQEAIGRLKQMRAAEGAVLAADLDGHCKAIREDLEQIRNRSATVLREYHTKLKKRVNELLANAKLKLDEEMLAREVAIFADRSDISEEITRLDSHLQQLAESCQANDQAGRRLEFLSQEMLREANTIASKASDIEIARYVVDVKCRIDRIKEQVQNIE